MTRRGRILSGMRPTGRLHLGNYVGALENWVQHQDAGWENFHMVADWHMLTTGHEDTSRLQSDIYDMVVDWLAAGLDPERSVIFVQSEVKEHAELHLLLSMLVSKARLERIPTLKEQIRDLHLDEQTISYGHLGYSVLQAADILLYRATHVPVGEDQVPHVELTREIARRFNFLYCQTAPPVFPEPEAQLTQFPRLRGLDGGRMSKSVGNTILLADTPEDIAEQDAPGATPTRRSCAPTIRAGPRPIPRTATEAAWCGSTTASSTRARRRRSRRRAAPASWRASPTRSTWPRSWRARWRRSASAARSGWRSRTRCAT